MDALNPLANFPLKFRLNLTKDSTELDSFATLSPDQQRDWIEQSSRSHDKWPGDITPQDLAP